MNQIAPVSMIMSKHLITLSPNDTLSVLKEVFEKNNFHHLPVVHLNKPVGIMSQSVFKGYLHALTKHFDDAYINDVLLKNEQLFKRIVFNEKPNVEYLIDSISSNTIKDGIYEYAS